MNQLTPPDTTNIHYGDYHLFYGKYYKLIGEVEKSKFHLNEAWKFIRDPFFKAQVAELQENWPAAISILDTLLITAENYPTRLEIAKRQEAAYDQLILEEYRAGRQEKVFELVERSKSIALRTQMAEAGKKADIEVKNLPAVQSLLQKDELLLSYKILDSLMLVFEIGTQKHTLKKVAVDSNFYYAAKELFYLIQRHDYSVDQYYPRFCKAAHALHGYLLGSVDRKGKELIIAADEQWFNIPFDLLLDEFPDTSQVDFQNLPYLVRSNPVRYVYTASMNGAVDYPQGKQLWVVPEQTQYRPLQGDVELFDQLVRRKGELMDGVLTLDGMLPELNLRPLLHLGTHGIDNPDSSLYSYLAISDDKLFVNEILEQDLPHGLVTLSACNTNKGKAYAGEGGVTIERAFLMAGAATVVSSFWEAEDKASFVLFFKFYQHLFQGEEPARALWKAKNEFLDEDFRLGHHPVLWANYAVIGKKGKLPAFARSPLFMVWYLVPVLVLLGLFFVFKPRFFVSRKH